MKITDFFNTDYVDQASYDNLRKIASLVDGQKNASRKILYTVLEKNIKEKIKVSQLNSKMAEFAEYLHGNADNVIVNLGQDYVGTNNLPLLQKKGNFGTRFSPDASASRYIYAYGHKNFFDLFKKEDSEILIKQTFEGQEIEPMFYVPNLPILLCNGSEGVSSGFAQKILPRNPECVKNYIKEYLKEPLGSVRASQKTSLIPYYNGFNGTIEKGENSSQWIIKGTIKRTSINKVQITEVPIGYNLMSYIKVLDDLEDKRIIQSYKDKSENDNFLFEVTVPTKDLKSWDDETLLTKLKLIKKVSENYTVINEHNKIEVFDGVKDIINRYIEVKLQYTQKRKDNLIEKLEQEIRLDYSKFLFIKMITEEELKINKRKKNEIVADLDIIDNIIKHNGNYDYLLSMAIHSLTEERMEQLEKSIKVKKSELDKLVKTSIEQLWSNEL